MNTTSIIRIAMGMWIAAALTFCASDSDDQNSGSKVDSEISTTGSTGYDVMSEDYYEDNTRVIWQRPEIVMQAIGQLEGKTVADIGAGTGFFTFRIAAAGANVVAVDVDRRAVRFIESEKKLYPAEISRLVKTRVGTKTSANLQPAEVDVALMVNTYIYIEDRVEYFTNLLKGLAPDGEVIIIDFKKKKTTIGPEMDDRISMQQVQYELSAAGYTITDIDDDTLEYQYLIKAVKQ